MKKVRVNANKPYDCLIGNGILPRLGELVSAVKKPCKAFLLSDDTVFSLYGKTAIKVLENSGFEVCSHIILHGEESKNEKVLFEILSKMSECGVGRCDLLVALGGGVVGDIGGFAASVYLRGIDFVTVPTTLLSGVDSSVGGKTAINTPFGKNLVGSFYQPILCVCDTDFYKSLPENIYADGIAECLKYGVIFDEELFELIKSKQISDEDLTFRCISLKAKIVEKDEREAGERRLLNFGHTMGHAIEKLSNFRISHGSAVAVGMVLASRGEEKARIIEALKVWGLPTKTEFSASEIFELCKADKKRDGDEILLIVPEKIGKCVIKPTKLSELLAFIKEGTSV